MSLPPPKLTRVTSSGSVVLKHRESLTMPYAHANIQPTRRTETHTAYPNIPVDENNDDLPYNGWMNQFCAEPGDCNAVAEAIFVPCVLYGKIEWRRARLARNQSADDSAWRAKDGCNGMCWAYYIVAHLGFWHTIMICVERTAVRGKYGIEGNMGTDCAISFFCDRCTLVNIDREIRAREGEMKLRNSDGYARYLRQQGIQNEQPGLNPPMAYLSPRPAQDQPSGKSTHQIPSDNRPEMSQASASNPIIRPSMAAVKNLGKPQKAQRRSKLSSAYLTPSDDDGEELLPQGKGKQRSMGNGNEQDRDQAVLRPHSLENCEATFVDIPLTQHDLANCKKSMSIPPELPTQHKLEDCEPVNLAAGLLQHELGNCRATPSPAIRPQHPLTQCENVAIDDPISQHGLERCQPTTSNTPNASSKQHILEQCQVTASNAPQKQHKLEQCESTPSKVSQKQHQLGQCVDTSPEMATAMNHTLALCEDSNGGNTGGDDSSRRRNSYPQHFLADCPVEFSGSKHYQTISGPSNKEKNNRHRLSSCPVSSPDSSEDQMGMHHVAENAEISTRNSLDNGVYTKASMGAIRPEEMRQTRSDVKRLATSQTMPTITIPDSQSRCQNQEARPRATSKGKQKSWGANEAKAAIDEYRTAENSAQLSLARFLESKGATVGHASSHNQAEILEAAARAVRRTRSDDGIAEDSDDSESLAGSGNAQEESNRGRSTWFARVASPFRGRE